MSRFPQTSTIFARRALLATGWAEDVWLELLDGRIARIDKGAEGGAEARVDTLLPALSNLHSHTFQRAMAGRTEHRRAGRDSFWTWRELMYRFTAHLTPEQVEAIAALAFVEMQEAGFAAVGEFHYLHHQPDGTPYDDPAELGARVAEAARATGIGLTLLPVLYTYGGAGRAPLEPAQARFGNDVDSFARLLERAGAAMGGLPPDSALGLAPHSLRATSPEDLAALLALKQPGPVHIHVAEQLREVEDVEAWLGQRPVAWLLDHAPVGPDWCLIHATHMSGAETASLARSGAVTGLCPITEANLGDGTFDGAAFLAAGGLFGVGTDSNVRISAAGELRQLEYSQRIRELSRNVLAAGDGSVGRTLYEGAARGGAQSLGRDAGRIEVGALADLCAIDGEWVALSALPPGQVLDGLVFAAPDGVVTDLWSAGRHAVRGGRHVAREAAVSGYRRAMVELTGEALS